MTMIDPVAAEGEPMRSSTEYLAWESVDVCPICASADRSVVDPAASVVRRKGCGHRYVEPRPTGSRPRARARRCGAGVSIESLMPTPRVGFSTSERGSVRSWR